MPEFVKRREVGKLGRNLGPSSLHGAVMLEDYLTNPFPKWTGNDDFTSGVRDWGLFGNGPDPLVTNQGPDFQGVGNCGFCEDVHKNMADAWDTGEQPKGNWTDSSVWPTPNQLVAEYLAYNNGQDIGVDLGQFLLWRCSNSLGPLKPIGGFAELSPPHGALYTDAFHVFGGLWAGIAVSQEMMDEAMAGEPWTSTATDWIGGHAVPHLARNSKWGRCITWGFDQLFSWQNWMVTAQEAFVVLTPEMMATPGGVFHGVNVAQLKTDIQKLHGQL